MAFGTSLRLSSLGTRSFLPLLVKGIARVGFRAQFALWLLSTPSLTLVKQIRFLFIGLLEYGFKKFPWFKPSLKLFNLSTCSLFLRHSLVLLVPVPLLNPTRAKTISGPEVRFAALSKPDPKIKPAGKPVGKPVRRADRLYDLVLLNSATKRYRSFLASLSPSQLINLYRASYFRHTKYYPPVSLLKFYFDGIKSRMDSGRLDPEPLIEQLVNQALGRGFLNPQAIYFGWEVPRLRSLPPSEALRFIHEKLFSPSAFPTVFTALYHRKLPLTSHQLNYFNDLSPVNFRNCNKETDSNVTAVCSPFLVGLSLAISSSEAHFPRIRVSWLRFNPSLSATSTPPTDYGLRTGPYLGRCFGSGKPLSFALGLVGQFEVGVYFGLCCCWKFAYIVKL
ncbi:hypothetical protein L0F63_006163 [Massospora cicadina]|nr:hypothetical protein L0F63_006163 [Massospora cicadina]